MWLLALAAGIMLSAVVIAFWNDIKEWLNNVAADAVERALGYNARRGMHRAVSTIDRVMNVIRNKTVVYTKRNPLDTHFDKTTLVAEAPVYEQKQEIIDDIEKEGKISQEFVFKQ